MSGPPLTGAGIGVQALIGFIGAYGGTMGVSYNGDEWTVVLEWGQEAAESPMVAAASYGVDTDLRVALRSVLIEIAATA